MPKTHIGLIGLGPMGANLARNIANKNFPIIVFNRTPQITKDFITNYGSENLTGAESLEELINNLTPPRQIILMVKAGEPVDMVIKDLKPLLNKGDIILDCGNSYFKDTIRREKELKENDLHFFGCGVSGGEEGALKGPSLMPGGNKHTYEILKPLFEAIAAKDFQGHPCVTYIGENGAGHYIKMVHNGIEYGIMQMIAESYHLLKQIYEMPAPKIAEIFTNFNKGKLKSYLFEISEKVLNKKDNLSDNYLVDQISDKAEQKGTGKWTSIDALDRNIALPIITEAVFARCLSGEKEYRNKLHQIYQNSHSPNPKLLFEQDFIHTLEDALFTGMILSYAQGFDLIKKASQEENWKINFSEIARIWQGGCIIRADLLKILEISFKTQNQTNLLEIPEIIELIKENIFKLRHLINIGIENKIPISALHASLSYFDSITANHLPANFIQGLRDYFGAHTYERIDQPGTFHTNWE